MRILEIIIIIVLITLIYVQFKNKQFKGLVFLLIGLLCSLILHFVLEGARWQMITVYAISILVIIKVFFKIAIKKKWLNILVTFFLILGILIGLLFSYVFPIFKLPHTQGEFAIGSYNQLFKNDELGDVNVKIWFPSGKHNSKNNTPYCYNPSEKLKGLMGMPSFIFSHLDLIKTNAFNNVSPIKDEKFPLIIYAHGASSSNIDNTALLENLSSNGYIVVAIDFNFSFKRYQLSKDEAMTLTLHAQEQFINKLIERTIPVQVKQILFTINQLKTDKTPFFDSIDFEKIILLGHSLGGSTCVSLPENAFIPTGVINIDGPIPSNAISNIKSPFLYISSYSPELPDNELSNKGLPDINFYRDVKRHELQNVNAFFNLNHKNSFWVRFENAGHLDFTDMPYILPLMTTKGYNKNRGHQLKSKIILNFLKYAINQGKTMAKVTNPYITWLSK